MQIYITAIFLLFSAHCFGGGATAFKFTKKHIKNNLKNPTTNIEYSVKEEVSWIEGEVAWEGPLKYEEDHGYDSYYTYEPTTLTRYNNNKVTPLRELSTRDRIWQFLEENYWRAGVSGALKGVYIQLGTGDVILNEIESFDNCDTYNLVYNPGTHPLANKAREVNNYNTEFEFLFTIATVISYRLYKKVEIEDLKNAADIATYMKIRQQSLLIVLCVLLIFTKNIKNAI
jgi:hypothetical protein